MHGVQKNGAGRQNERGYVLITLICFTALLAITAAATLPSLIFELKRDREEECIHRGVQYTRAVRSYAKKYGRYPNRIEDLEDTSGIRFLRRRYKDPITGQDFKILHMADVQLTYGAGSTALLEAHKNPGPTSAPSTDQSGPNPSSPGVQNATPGASPSPQAQGNPDDPNNANTATGDAGAVPSGQTTPGQSTSVPGTSGLNAGASGSNNPSSQVFGGGPIVGVVSLSKQRSIREFKQKNHYNQWQFYYDPSTDRGLPPNMPSLPFQPPQGSLGAAGPGKSPSDGAVPDASQQTSPPSAQGPASQ